MTHYYIITQVLINYIVLSPDGSSLIQIHQTSDGNFISEVDWNEQTSRIALKTNNSSGYNVSIYTINTSGVVQDIILDNVTGAAGGLDFSFDGSQAFIYL